MAIRDIVSAIGDLPTLLALKRGLKPRPLDTRDCLGAAVERNARRVGDCVAVVTEDETVSWSEFNARANRYAHALEAAGLTRGDVASVMMENGIDFLAIIVALNKLGVTASLINTSLRERPLTHCVSITGSKQWIFGGEFVEAVRQVKGELGLREGADYHAVPLPDGEAPPDWASDLRAESDQCAATDPPTTAATTLGETAMYIFTSGTTGLPKAAVLSNRRYLASAQLTAKAGLRCDEQDRIYICLPLYHGTGLMIGAGAAFASGASMFVRKRFSATSFLPEIRAHGCNCFIYVGELCRYLVNTPERADDADSPLVTMMGNGLRPDMWLDFKRRFGIRRVTEFYGASEGNVAFANLLNKDCTIGMTSSKVALVRYDVDADVIERADDGRCVAVAPGEPGLLLGHINPEAVFEGYTDSAATDKKILRDVFVQGDAWFNTGDLIREVDVGFALGYPHYQFVDRTGDTFRWKSENVSTNEVSDILSAFPGIEFCNVYGVRVPGAEGRAGMAAVSLTADAGAFDWEAFAAHARAELPPFARPVFVRVRADMALTGTYKLVKGDLRREGFDINAFADAVYVMKPDGDRYEPLDGDYLQTINAGAAGF